MAFLSPRASALDASMPTTLPPHVRRAFANEGNFKPTGAYYMLDLPGVARVISINNYVSSSGGS